MSAKSMQRIRRSTLANWLVRCKRDLPIHHAKAFTSVSSAHLLVTARCIAARRIHLDATWVEPFFPWNLSSRSESDALKPFGL
jgi:hypothetical protein